MIHLRRSTILVEQARSAIVHVGAEPNTPTATTAPSCPPCVCPSTFGRDLLLAIMFGAASALGATLIGRVI